MNTNIFIPEKINVGFQNREDTYTKKLAYIIYFDEKGKLRKEASWNGWRDKKIEPIQFENAPTSGFVLNKKAGGYDTGWNHRQTYCRVYDPRDFEFEITIPNLLYILENTNSIKGKGLEGNFVYGWDGKDLVLIPCDSPDYKELTEYNELIHSKNYIKTKDLILGATYRTKDNEEYVYMGRFDYWTTKSERMEKPNPSGSYYNRYSYDYIYHDVNKGLHYYFVPKGEKVDSYYTLKLKNLGNKFIQCISSECVENYADLSDQLECTKDFSPYDESKNTYELRTFEDFNEQMIKNDYWWNKSFLGNVNREYIKLNIHKYSSLNNSDLNKRTDFYVRKENENDYRYEGEQWRGNRKQIFNESLFSGTIEDIYKYFQPAFRCKYLKNNKLYEKDVY